MSETPLLRCPLAKLLYGLVVAILLGVGAWCVSVLISTISNISTLKPKTVHDLLREKGMPAMIADRAQVRGTTLVCSGLDVWSPERQDNLTRKVLLYGEEEDLLLLQLALTKINMSRASPILGQEGPGATLELISEKPVVLNRPVRVSLAFIDSQGRARREMEVEVLELSVLNSIR